MPDQYCRNAITVLGTLASSAPIESFLAKKIILITNLYTRDSYPSFSPHYLFQTFKRYPDKPQALEKIFI
jgi:hypothetical protein